MPTDISNVGDGYWEISLIDKAGWKIVASENPKNSADLKNSYPSDA